MIHIISAIQKSDRGIGYNNDLLYHISDDLKRFRALTTGNVVIMGRKTWESLPDAFRPLPHRENIVVSSNPDYDAPGASVITSLEEALEYARTFNKEIFIIGGSSLYASALPFADQLHLTIIDGNRTADVFFPPFEDIFRREIKRDQYTSPDGITYSIVILEK